MTELNLSDFGIHLAGEGDKPAGTGPKRLFPEAPLGLSRLEGASLDLTISVDDIIDPLVSMQRIDTHLVWNEKSFALQPTVFVYEGGHVNLVLSTDFTQDPPAHRLLIAANDMNLGNFLSHFREGEPLVEGKLTVDAGLEARGDSPHEIASSLSGDLALALEEGRLNHVNLRLLAPRTFQWFTAATGGRSYTILSCVIARFDVAEGVAKSDNLYVRAPDVRLTGAGSIDFGKEELDIVLAAPRPALAPPGLEKPVRFHGNLADPEVQTSATGHAVNLGIAMSGVVLMPMIFVPWLAASAMFSQLDEEGEDSACLIFCYTVNNKFIV
jgi:AsmA protein